MGLQTCPHSNAILLKWPCVVHLIQCIRNGQPLPNTLAVLGLATWTPPPLGTPCATRPPLYTGDCNIMHTLQIKKHQTQHRTWQLLHHRVGCEGHAFGP